MTNHTKPFFSEKGFRFSTSMQTSTHSHFMVSLLCVSVYVFSCRCVSASLCFRVSASSCLRCFVSSFFPLYLCAFVYSCLHVSIYLCLSVLVLPRLFALASFHLTIITPVLMRLHWLPVKYRVIFESVFPDF